MKYKCILIIDDDFDSVFLTGRMIEKLKIAGQVHSAGNGKLALDFIETNCNKMPGKNLLCPDVIFVDIKMPVMDGFEFLKAMQKQHQQLLDTAKVFMLSASDSQDDIEKTRSFNIDGFVSKPLTAKKIIETLFDGDILNN